MELNQELDKFCRNPLLERKTPMANPAALRT